MYVDTHCHVISEYYNNIEDVLICARENGVEKIIVNGYDLKSNLEVLELAKRYDMIYAAIGFHPSELESFDYNFLRNCILNDKVVAIGEIGLDYHYDSDNDTKEKQISIFKKQLELAIEFNKPVIIHARDSIMDIYNVICSYNNIQGVLHCYSGSLEMAKLFINKGLLLGVGGVVTFENAKTIKDVVKCIDLNHFLLETDSPYLTPVPYRGRTNEPSYIPLIAKAVADLKGVDVSVVSEVTTNNARRIFDF